MWPHLQVLNIPELSDVNEVHLLIGSDCRDLFLSTERRTGNKGEPFTEHTPLGWTVNGPVGPSRPTTRSAYYMSVESRGPQEDLARMWEMEGSHSEEEGLSIEDRKAMRDWEDS